MLEDNQLKQMTTVMSRQQPLWLLILFLLLTAAVAPSEAYPTGAPSSACDNMIPGHGVVAQSSLSPYQITVSSPVLRAGQSLVGMLITYYNYEAQYDKTILHLQKYLINLLLEYILIFIRQIDRT